MKYHLMPFSCALLLSAATAAYAAEPAAKSTGPRTAQEVTEHDKAQDGGASKATMKEFTVTKQVEAAQTAVDHDHDHGQAGDVAADTAASHAGTHGAAAETSGAAGATGKATFKEFTVTKKTDAASTADAKAPTEPATAREKQKPTP